FSALDVAPTERHIENAVDCVIESYRANRDARPDNRILVQAQTERVDISGVVFTRQIETNAPYYVINFDAETGRTDTVTGGREGRTIYVSRFNKFPVEKKWVRLLSAVKEIEDFFPGRTLDIEFALTKSGKVVIFQVRPLAANRKKSMPDDSAVKDLLSDMSEKFARYSGREPHLAGKRTIFGDMPDWNPSEIIGSRPNTLDYTVYSFIVTDDIWHQARGSLGYYDVYPAELMVSFAKKPYIDTRASFNSFTPASIDRKLREKLVNFYLDKLEENPELQDKVEFEILWTCYDFSAPGEIQKLKRRGFRGAEIKSFIAALRALTNDILKRYPAITGEDMSQVKLLTARRDLMMKAYRKNARTPWNSLRTAYNILQNCKKFGTFPFSRQARIAFIAKALLMSLKRENVISESFYHDFLNSIRTVASVFNDDFRRLESGRLKRSEFIGRYGHLRAGTYDITSPRYDEMPGLFSLKRPGRGACGRPEVKYVIPRRVSRAVSLIMKRHGLCGDGAYMFDFIRQAIQNRECAKFEFTRSLSDALELIAGAGAMLGFKRDELCHADLPTLMKFRNPERADAAYARKIIGQSVERHRKERQWYDAVILPPVIARERDLYVARPYAAIPNFITRKSVSGKSLKFDEIKRDVRDIMSGNILLLENADPGFDWIFTKNPLGIITKYGGVASHMSIRCAEFGIPAAIGCGDGLYDKLLKSDVVTLDCGRKVVRPAAL
ncbi:MAG: PEP-utilizing enzyme, partial [Candidatus Omnitrophota bacterium]